MKVKINSPKELTISEISSLQEANKRIKQIEKALDIKYTKVQFKGKLIDKDGEYCYFDSRYYMPVKITNNFIRADVDGEECNLTIPEDETISFNLTSY